jgi:predicted glycoside hydrolase/deacetylase ChbG (UPF0249 family)
MGNLILTADDFGRSRENNAGVMAAFQSNCITTASLMVGEPAVMEAVDFIRTNSCPIGLHICLSDGDPVSPPERIALLVDPETGRFPLDETRLFKAVLSREGRRQIRTEVAAQLQVYSWLNLACDHLDVHRNSHRHPLVANEIFKLAAKQKIQKVRIPYDPPIGRRRRPADPLRYARCSVLRRLATYYGLTAPDYSINRLWNDPERLLGLIATLPPSHSTELYFHPVVTDSDHMFKTDLPTLLAAIPLVLQ